MTRSTVFAYFRLYFIFFSFSLLVRFFRYTDIYGNKETNIIISKYEFKNSVSFVTSCYFLSSFAHVKYCLENDARNTRLANIFVNEEPRNNLIPVDFPPSKRS